MDPITQAIVSALAAGAAAGGSKVAEGSIVAGYNALKSLIQRKFGDESDLAKAVAGLEARPDSEGRKITLQEEVGYSEADQDEQILATARQLLESIQTVEASSDRSVAIGGDVTGSTIVTGDQHKVDTGGGAYIDGDVDTAGGDVIGHDRIDAQGDVLIGGTKVVYPDPAEEAGAELENARRRYLERLKKECQVLPLAALGGEEIGEQDITLDRVYIQLDTTSQVEIREKIKEREKRPALVESGGFRPLTALEAAAKSSQLVLLGDPGSGKSTFVRNLLAWLAAANLDQVPPPPGFDPELMPVLVILRDLAPRLSNLKLEDLSAWEQKEISIEVIKCQIRDYLSGLNAKAFTEGILQALESGRCLLVLDGLDEVPHDLRKSIRFFVDTLMREYQLERVIVTCRTRSYTGGIIFPNFEEVRLAPFDSDKVFQFANAWYNAQRELGRVNADQAQEKASDLAQVALGQDLREISSNPMLLTAMAIIHQKEIGLPRELVRLYNLVVEVLLHRWQKHKQGEKGLAPSPELRSFLRNDLRLRAAIERLAYEAHIKAEGEAESVDLDRGTSLTLLEAPTYLGNVRLAAEFLDYVDQRAGLLLGRGGELDRPASYIFPHRSFQEYLAGSYMAGQRDLAREFFARAGEGDAWSLAAQLGAEELVYNRRNSNTLLDLAYRLCSELKDEQHERATLWSGVMATLLDRETIECDTEIPDGGLAYLSRLLPSLVQLLGGSLSPPERAQAGRILAKLGDPRAEVTTLQGMEFCLVPGGVFVMGSNESIHLVEIPTFWISRFPVTNAQFALFISSSAYREPRFWSEAIQGGVWQDGVIKDRYGDSPRNQPTNFGEPYNISNHPVVGITWHEALAFTRWLTRYGLDNGWFPESWQVNLPSEAEWEKAARGGQQIPTDPSVRIIQFGISQLQDIDKFTKNPDPNRAYPWGDEPDPDKANYGETGIGTTSPVGCFPDGASPYLVQDLSGNVWEWTRSLYRNYPYVPNDGRENLEESGPFILRGGAFHLHPIDISCAYRNWYDPDNWYRGIGFRVVVSPPAPGL